MDYTAEMQGIQGSGLTLGNKTLAPALSQPNRIVFDYHATAHSAGFHSRHS